MTSKSSVLSVLLMLFLTGRAISSPICGRMGEKFVCYNITKERIVQLIKEKARRLEIDPELALALAKAESNLNPLAYSKKGAIGIMQLLPETAHAMGVDPWDIEENIEGGLKYFKSLLKRYKGNTKLALAAYNAGPGAVERHGGIPPYKETKRFVKKVKGKQKSSSIRVIHLPDGTILITNLPPELVQ